MRERATRARGKLWCGRFVGGVVDNGCIYALCFNFVCLLEYFRSDVIELKVSAFICALLKCVRMSAHKFNRDNSKIPSQIPRRLSTPNRVAARQRSTLRARLRYMVKCTRVLFPKYLRSAAGPRMHRLFICSRVPIRKRGSRDQTTIASPHRPRELQTDACSGCHLR